MGRILFKIGAIITSKLAELSWYSLIRVMEDTKILNE